MTETLKAEVQARSALAINSEWRQALDTALAGLAGIKPDLLFVFASASYAQDLPALIQAAYQESGSRFLLGCSGLSLIGRAQEVEDEKAISLLGLTLPGVELFPTRLTQRDLVTMQQKGGPVLSAQTGVKPAQVNGWVIFGDPFSLDPELLLQLFGEAYPRLPVLGGLATGSANSRHTYLFQNDQVFNDGAIGLAIGGAYELQAVVSQGCMPIGQDWMVTSAEGQIVHTISGRPALQILSETLRGLTPQMQMKVRNGLLVGLAIDEYRDSFGRGDFLMRGLAGIDQQSGAIGVGGLPRVGQTIQFQLRDAEAADQDLRELLQQKRQELGETRPFAGVLFSCNGRGTGLFGTPDHDAAGIADQFGDLPLAGFFCNGEFGPIGGKNFLHGFTASLGLFVKKP